LDADANAKPALQFRKRRQYLQQRAAEDRAEEDGPSSQVCIAKSKSKSSTSIL
jgi:hypothetical protein